MGLETTYKFGFCIILRFLGALAKVRHGIWEFCIFFHFGPPIWDSEIFIYSVSWNPISPWREKSHLKSFCYILAYFLQYVIFQLLWVNRKHHYKGKITYYKNMKKWGLEIGAASEINILQKFYSEMLIEYKWKLRIFISRGTRPSYFSSLYLC